MTRKSKERQKPPLPVKKEEAQQSRIEEEIEEKIEADHDLYDGMVGQMKVADTRRPFTPPFTQIVSIPKRKSSRQINDQTIEEEIEAACADLPE